MTAADPDLRARFVRLRWRMRGAWMWPAFVALTVADGVLLLELPFYDAAPDDLYGTLLVAGVINLAAVALVAPVLGWLVRRRAGDLPREVARDYAGTALLCAIAAGFLGGGLVHRPAVREAERDLARGAAAVRDWVQARAPATVPGLARADVLRLEEDLYRFCVPETDPERPLCLIVETDEEPAVVRPDGDRTPNSDFRVPGGFD